MARKIKGMDAQLFEEGKKRFQQILEYTVLGNTVMGEADDDGQDDGQGAAPQGGQDPMGSMPQDGGQGMPDAAGGMPPQGGQDPMAAQQQDGGQQPQAPEGFAPQQGEQPMDGGMPQDDGMAQGDQPSAEDDVVDISALTDAQEDTESEVSELNNKFSEIMSKLDSFVDLIKSNDEKIEDIKAEYERRNPTQVEKMSMNTAKGGPFTVSPEEYWDEKEKTSNYRRESDDNGKEQGQYVITANDVNGNTDWKGISDSLDDDIIMHQTLNKIMGI